MSRVLLKIRFPSSTFLPHFALFWSMCFFFFFLFSLVRSPRLPPIFFFFFLFVFLFRA